MEDLAARQMKQWCLQGCHRRQRRVDDGRLIVGGHLHDGLEVNPGSPVAFDITLANAMRQESWIVSDVVP